MVERQVYLSVAYPPLPIQPVIKGIQQNKVVANAKHWVNNNQETNRGAVAELVDERTRFEMYYPPFVGAVEAGVGSFMCRVVKCQNHLKLLQN